MKTSRPTPHQREWLQRLAKRETWTNTPCVLAPASKSTRASLVKKGLIQRVGADASGDLYKLTDAGRAEAAFLDDSL